MCKWTLSLDSDYLVNKPSTTSIHFLLTLGIPFHVPDASEATDTGESTAGRPDAGDANGRAAVDDDDPQALDMVAVAAAGEAAVTEEFVEDFRRLGNVDDDEEQGDVAVLRFPSTEESAKKKTINLPSCWYMHLVFATTNFIFKGCLMQKANFL